MRHKTSHIGFRATPELKEAVERAALAQGLKAGEWIHAVVEKAIKTGVLVRQQTTFESVWTVETDNTKTNCALRGVVTFGLLFAVIALT